MKTIYYYQSFTGLEKALENITDIDVIIVSSIHFGKNGQQPYIHLNDNDPGNTSFDKMWMETKKASVQGCKIMLMMGGAGYAYRTLFTDFDIYYQLLTQMIRERPWISGIDLDIEEETTLENVQMLIRHLVDDFGPSFTITMAPISLSLESDGGSMAGFNYKTLYESPEGNHISWFHTQCYYSFSKNTYDKIIQNGYPPEKVVMGMESGQFTKGTFHNALQEVHNILSEYPTMAGVYDWEYLDAPPDDKDPSKWASLMKSCSKIT